MDLCSQRVLKKNLKKNEPVGFLSGSPRFNQFKSSIIGPGVYKPKLLTRKFQSGNHLIFRDRPHRIENKLNIPPNLYANGLKHNMIETLIKKKVSKRGPYDIFTGPRDSSTLYGHVSEKKCYLLSDSWPLPLSANLFIASGNKHTYTNLFKKNEPKKTEKLEKPSFSCVNLRDWIPSKTNKHPFNSTSSRGESHSNAATTIGPDHYNINPDFYKRYKNGYTNVFRSTTIRGIPIARGYSIFDN